MKLSKISAEKRAHLKLDEENLIWSPYISAILHNHLMNLDPEICDQEIQTNALDLPTAPKQQLPPLSAQQLPSTSAAATAASNQSLLQETTLHTQTLVMSEKDLIPMEIENELEMGVGDKTVEAVASPSKTWKRGRKRKHPENHQEIKINGAVEKASKKGKKEEGDATKINGGVEVEEQQEEEKATEIAEPSPPQPPQHDIIGNSKLKGNFF